MATNTQRVLMGLVAVIIVVIFSYDCLNVQAQTRTPFLSSDRFNIPDFNSTISFAQNGSYSSATLQNDTWTFNDLRFNISQPIGNLKVSAENSNMTIFSFRSYNLFGRSAQLRYNAQGTGTQTVNLGLNVSQPTHPIEWSVGILGNSFLAEGDGWRLLPDDSVFVYGLTGNISVTHYGFSVPSESNLPFYQQHSIVIVIAIVLSIVIAIAAVIRVKVRD
jgi:hypothetical protein